MRNAINIIGILLLISMCSACVSLKKYKQLEYERSVALAEKLNSAYTLKTSGEQVDILRRDTAQCKAAYREMEAQYALLQQKSSNNSTLLQEKINKAEQKDIKKDSIIADKEAAIAAAETQITKLEKDLDNKDKAQTALLNSVKKALKGTNSSSLQLEERNGRAYVILSEELLFPSGSATVDYKMRQNIEKLAQLINRNPSIDIIVEGHTDNMELGSTAIYKNNWELSVARAAAVTRTLSVDYKVAPIRLVAAGRGNAYPINSNSTDEQRRRNRRVDIILMPKLNDVYNILNKKP